MLGTAAEVPCKGRNKGFWDSPHYLGNKLDRRRLRSERGEGTEMVTEIQEVRV